MGKGKFKLYNTNKWKTYYIIYVYKIELTLKYSSCFNWWVTVFSSHIGYALWPLILYPNKLS